MEMLNGAQGEQERSTGRQEPASSGALSGPQRAAVVHTLQERSQRNTSNACFWPRTFADAEQRVCPVQPQKRSPYEHPEVGVGSGSIVAVVVGVCNSNGNSGGGESGKTSRPAEVWLTHSSRCRMQTQLRSHRPRFPAPAAPPLLFHNGPELYRTTTTFQHPGSKWKGVEKSKPGAAAAGGRVRADP